MLSQLRERKLGVGERFKTFDIVDVTADEIGRLGFKVDDIMSINRCVGIKQFHCMLAAGPSDALFRVSTCTCRHCQIGSHDLFERDQAHGKWINHSLIKPPDTVGRKRGRPAKNPVPAEVDSEVEDDDEVMYDDDDDENEDDYEFEAEEEEEVQDVSDIILPEGVKPSVGDMVVVGLENKQFIAEVWQCGPDATSCKFMKRDFGSVSDHVLKFRFPYLDDITDVDNGSIFAIIKSDC